MTMSRAGLGSMIVARPPPAAPASGHGVTKVARLPHVNAAATAASHTEPGEFRSLIVPTPLYLNTIAAAVDHVLDTISGTIVLGAPLGIGKPNPFINALYRRIRANPARRLTIITALSLEKPVGQSELERHFLAPLVERVFGD
jgi:hypothetical protein